MKTFRDTLKEAEEPAGIPILVKEFDGFGPDIKEYLETVWPNLSRTSLMHYSTKLMLDMGYSTPIEQKLYLSLLNLYVNEIFNYPDSFCIKLNHKISQINQLLIKLTGHPLEEYRSGQDIDYEIDIFLLQNNRFNYSKIKERVTVPVYMGIECDGHNFHNATKYQAQKDRKKDRILKLYGMDIIRFTGGEISTNPNKCANEVNAVLNKKRDYISSILNA